MSAHSVPSEIILDALQLACRAPSLHNSQPWRWVVTPDRVDLFADPARLLRGSDASGGEALISCGAALHHFRVAMAAAGWDTGVRRFPDENDRRHLAAVDFTPAATVTDHQKRRADAILLRHTERLPLEAPTDWDRLSGLAQTVAETGSVRIDQLADEDRPTVAEASRLANFLRDGDPLYQDELHVATSDFASPEAIPMSALPSSDQQRRVDVGRDFPATTSLRRHPSVTEDRSAILVISTVGDTAENVLRCGEALSTVLLDATTAGLSTCTVSHVTEVASGREVVAALLGDRVVPQVLVRVGRVATLDPPPPATPRRPIDEVVEIRRGTR